MVFSLKKWFSGRKVFKDYRLRKTIRRKKQVYKMNCKPVVHYEK